MKQNELTVKFKILSDRPGINIPAYHSLHASGMDIRSSEYDFIFGPGEFKMVSTSIAAEIPEGYELQVRARSGLAAKKGIGVLNGPGTIDADYRGEIRIILFNFSKEPVEIKFGDRIAQLVLSSVIRALPVRTDEINETARGHGGFGSSGSN
ncbi:MAG: dUTP diphosphatase [Fibrobacterota bacterium]